MHISPSTPPYVLSITQALSHGFTHAPLAPFPASLGRIRFSRPLALGLFHDPTLDIYRCYMFASHALWASYNRYMLSTPDIKRWASAALEVHCVIALGNFVPRAYYPPHICGLRASPRWGGTAAAV